MEQQNKEQRVEPPPCEAPPIIRQPPTTINQPVIIEQTDKQWKGLMVLGTVLFVVGMLSCFMPLCVIGTVIYLGARYCAWWHHS